MALSCLRKKSVCTLYNFSKPKALAKSAEQKRSSNALMTPSRPPPESLIMRDSTPPIAFASPTASANKVSRGGGGVGEASPQSGVHVAAHDSEAVVQRVRALLSAALHLTTAFCERHWFPAWPMPLLILRWRLTVSGSLPKQGLPPWVVRKGVPGEERAQSRVPPPLSLMPQEEQHEEFEPPLGWHVSREDLPRPPPRGFRLGSTRDALQRAASPTKCLGHVFLCPNMRMCSKVGVVSNEVVVDQLN